MTKQRKNIGILAFDRVNLLDVSGPAQVFSEANHVSTNTSINYGIQVYSQHGGMVRSDCGIELNASSFETIQSKTLDTLIIAGGPGVNECIKDAVFVDNVKRCCKHTRRFGSVCTGAFVLASTGLLDGKKAVTHWQHLEKFQHNFPKVRVQNDPIYVLDGGVWSSAGISAGIDLGLAMVAEDLGNRTALQTAQALVVYLKRSGGQSQFSAPLNAQIEDRSGRFGRLHVWITDHLDQDLSTNQLAEFMNMSPRSFFRLYKNNLGTTPARDVELIRLEAAKRRLEASTNTIQSVALNCGFKNEERMRRVFIRNCGVSPGEYRKRFGQTHG